MIHALPLLILLLYRTWKIRNHTDWHDVDEELAIAPIQGGHWSHGVGTGMMNQHMNRSPNYSGDVMVASECRHLWWTLNYTDWFDVDEDQMTVACHGGCWCEDQAGIAHRNPYNNPFLSGGPSVASSNIRNWSFIIRIFTMSTKRWGLLSFMVRVGTITSQQVPRNDICFALPLIYPWMLLRRSLQSARYTDEHHVDEDLTTVLLQGGWWAQGTFTGITYREMIFAPTDAYTIVASKK